MNNYIVTNKKTGEVFYFKTIYQICDMTGLTRSQISFRLKKDYDETWKIEYIGEKDVNNQTVLKLSSSFRKQFTKEWIEMQKLFGIEVNVNDSECK